MKPNDFVYQQIYKGALAKKVNERVAHQQALIGLDKYKKSAMGGAKVSKFIEDQIAIAKRLSKGLK